MGPVIVMAGDVLDRYQADIQLAGVVLRQKQQACQQGRALVRRNMAGGARVALFGHRGADGV